jgi:hypothetical protein
MGLKRRLFLPCRRKQVEPNGFGGDRVGVAHRAQAISIDTVGNKYHRISLQDFAQF